MLAPVVVQAARVAVARSTAFHPLLDKDDRMQEALLAAWLALQRADKDSPPAALFAYLLRRAEGAILDALRTLRSQEGSPRGKWMEAVHLELLNHDAPDPGACPAAILRVQRAIKSIEPRRRGVAEQLAMGYEGAEVAHAMGVDPKRVSQFKNDIGRHLERHL